jgi:hypothetical protein
MDILVACEESGRVRDEFIKLGHNAISCDILPTSSPGPHIQGDVIPLLKEKWDMIIAFPPCTHLASSGARWFKEKIADGRQQQGIDFFMEFVNAPCDKKVIENPVGVMSTHYRKPDQIIHPWMFGDSFSKSTCLWLTGVKKLIPTNIVSKGEFLTFPSGKRMAKWYSDNKNSKIRSQTFPGIAKAMAEQWGNL